VKLLNIPTVVKYVNDHKSDGFDKDELAIILILNRDFDRVFIGKHFETIFLLTKNNHRSIVAAPENFNHNER